MKLSKGITATVTQLATVFIKSDLWLTEKFYERSMTFYRVQPHFFSFLLIYGGQLEEG